MNLLDALELLKRPVRRGGSVQRVFLACGFTPLHLQTFLAAHFRLRSPGDHFEIATGLYGDLAGILERLQPSGLSGLCAVVEWCDLDPRLGIRSLGGWRAADIPDMVESARRQSQRLTWLFERLTDTVPICICMPTLPIPPVFTTRTHQGHHHEFQLREVAASLALSFSGNKGVTVLSPQRLEEVSPLAQRFDAKAEIASGFPYQLGHASALAELLASSIQNSPPKKGLITDLDDTLWAGILGEVGVDGISWDMAGHAHMHGLYQQFLASLASAGVLIGAASKNDPALAEQALARGDILLPRKSIFPLEAHWGRKSESVQRILKVWNVGSEEVIFIDDSPMEVAEVHSGFPQMECIVFPKNDYPAIWDLLKRLRDSFGKSTVSQEDDLRLQSIRNSAALRESLQVPGVRADDFLQNAKASILFWLGTDAMDSRALELINKTNQFNLNGKRFSESDWMAYLKDPRSFLLTTTYEDKYGPLGKIAVLLGRMNGRILKVDAWVMSCRAFSRRIEHQCLRYLFDKFQAEEIVFDYQATNRNGPLQEFFSDLLGQPPRQTVQLSNEWFSEKAPSLFHRVRETAHGRS